jgi:hypothetical protein
VKLLRASGSSLLEIGASGSELIGTDANTPDAGLGVKTMAY